MKNSFVLYTDYLEQIKLLDMEQRGILITNIFLYQIGEQIEEMDGMTMMAFAFIKSQIDRDNDKYEETIKKRKEAGAIGGKQKVANLASAKSAKQKVANLADNVNDNVNVNVNVNKDILSCNTTEYPYKDVIDYLNLVAGTKFKDKSKDSRKHIKARFDEGFTLDDFKKVIDIKVSEWKNDPEMSGFIRPMTLFGTKFESYLNQTPKKRKYQNYAGRGIDMDEIQKLMIKNSM